MRNLDVLLAWLDAGRRRDRDAMRALLSPDATWQGQRACSTPDAVVAMWLRRAAELERLEAIELTADERGAALRLRAPSLPAGAHIAFEIDDDGRIVRLAGSARRCDAAPRGVPEAPLHDGVPQGEGWFVVNVADAPWKTGAFGAYTSFEGDARFEQLGVNIGVMEPGQPACFYHREGEQEDFLVLRGEALLLVEGEERRLRAWDFVHCPPWTEHVFVGTGTEPCAVLAIGGRTGGGVVYPVSELALRHRAGVERQTTTPAEAYAAIPPDEPTEVDPHWLPGR